MKIRSPEYWRARAEEARSIAESTMSIDGGRAMHEVATLYDELARRS